MSRIMIVDDVVNGALLGSSFYEAEGMGSFHAICFEKCEDFAKSEITEISSDYNTRK